MHWSDQDVAITYPQTFISPSPLQPQLLHGITRPLSQLSVSQISLSDDVRPRWSHAMSVFQLAPGLVEAIIFGGMALTRNTISATTILRLGEHKLKTVLYLNLFQGSQLIRNTITWASIATFTEYHRVCIISLSPPSLRRQALSSILYPDNACLSVTEVMSLPMHLGPYQCVYCERYTGHTVSL